VKNGQSLPNIRNFNSSLGEVIAAIEDPDRRTFARSIEP
jgi:hypothetical protein